MTEEADFKNIYSDIYEKGGLWSALRSLDESNLLAEASTNESPSKAHAYIELKNRYSTVSLALRERLFIADFWESGICLGAVNTSSFERASVMLQSWLSTEIKLAELRSTFPEIKAREIAPYFEVGKEVEGQWALIISHFSRNADPLLGFAELGQVDPVLGRLFPFTSHFYFCFSLCTGYPY